MPSSESYKIVRVLYHTYVNLLTSLMFVLILATALSVCTLVIWVDGTENKQGAVVN
jgi:hypothetical protein